MWFTITGRGVEDVTEHPAMQPHINAAALTYELGTSAGA